MRSARALLGAASMRTTEATIPKPCGADWSEMTPAGASARRCAECATLVHDLSTMSPAEARAIVEAGGRCVRYLYDVNGDVVFGAPPRDALIVAAGALLSKTARRKWLAIASIAALPVLLEACGGVAPTARDDAGAEEAEADDSDDAGADARAFERADARVGDGG